LLGTAKSMSARSQPRWCATYRLQLGGELGFARAAELAPYLAALGVSHVYLSPILRAERGSTHGYDVVDHGAVNGELGGEEGFVAMCGALERHGLAVLLDIVPNHMSISSADNLWWNDILENGQASRYADYFDVDWAAGAATPEKVLMPILGDHYGVVLEAGDIRLARTGARFFVRVYERELPAAPRSIAEILGPAATLAGCDELAFLADAFAALPSPSTADADARTRRARDQRVLQTMLARLLDEGSAASAIDETLRAIEADTHRLDAFLDRQNYRLAHWKTSRHDLGYRRFFDVNELVALRMEHRQAFADTHRTIIRLVKEGLVAGLRIDHVDGLRDPERYLDWLRAEVGDAYVVVEKILARDERIPGEWPVEGTTGYDFLSVLNGLFVDRAGAGEIDAIYREHTRNPKSFHETALAAKEEVLASSLASDLLRLVVLLRQVCELHRRYRDYGDPELASAITAMLIELPVYRTYLRPPRPVRSEDAAIVRGAAERARARVAGLEPLVDLVEKLLLGELPGTLEETFVCRFQQLSGPLAAKGIEDTALFRYSRLLSLNEVGVDPDRIGTTLDEFHRFCADVGRRTPRTLVATSTHDTKRSEDVRLRISLLSFHAERWREVVRACEAVAQRGGHTAAVDPETRWYLYQTLAGAWPIEHDRLCAHLEKATREAKRGTSWTRPGEEFERAVKALAQDLGRDSDLKGLLDLTIESLARDHMRLVLSNTLLHLTAVGVPDLYQGTEVVDDSLTDPDNRRPVDFAMRAALANEVAAMPAEDALARGASAAKLWLVMRTLELRRREPDAFEGSYEPVFGDDRVVAFARGGRVVVVAPRTPHAPSGTIALPSGRWRDVLVGGIAHGEVRIAELLARFPVALLLREQ
jgi:(1->4)-alpha-D-glucan 1-alpha-D-glucosylmutase